MRKEKKIFSYLFTVLTLLTIFICLLNASFAQTTVKQQFYQNPILGGDCPDPSVNEVSFYYSINGKDWVRLERTLYVAGFNHNVFGGFMSLRAGIYAFGKGKVVFDNFKYIKLMN